MYLINTSKSDLLNKVAVVTGLAIVGFAITANQLHACDCFGPWGRDAIRAAHRIAAIRVTEEINVHRSGLREYEAEVLCVWKGFLSPTVILKTEGGSACELDYEPGEEYLIFVGDHRGDETGLRVTTCSGSGRFQYRLRERYHLRLPAIVYDDTVPVIDADALIDSLVVDSRTAETVAMIIGDQKDEAATFLPWLTRIAVGYTPGNRVQALNAIARLGSAASRAYPQLEELYLDSKDTPEKVRGAALIAMVGTGDDIRKLRQLVLQGISVPEPEIKIAAMESTGYARLAWPRHSREVALRRIRSNLTDPDPDVRLVALERCWLGADRRSVPWIKRMLNDDDPDIRDRARRTLEYFRTWH